MADNGKPSPQGGVAGDRRGSAGERGWEGATRLVNDDSLALPPGTRIGRYELVGVLGEGSFGITYRARDLELHRDVAVKEYLPAGVSIRQLDGTVLARSTQSAETFLWGRERFVEEARTLARLENAAGIVNVYDIVSANGTAYMVMAFVAGETLQTRLDREGRLSQATIDRLLPPLLDGLEQVHRAGFLHRDIKPANILVDEGGLPTLIDFGASRAAWRDRTSGMTAVYTPAYAAFEQFTSARQGPWTDIYGLGATLYHGVTGAPPPGAGDRMLRDTLVPAIQAGDGRYRPALLAAIDAALKVKPTERPQTIADWRRLLEGVPRSDMPLAVAPAAGGMAGAAGGHAAPAPDVKRRWSVRAAIAAVIIVLSGGGAYLAWRIAHEGPSGAAEPRPAPDDGPRRMDEAARRTEEKARAEAEAARAAEDVTWARARQEATEAAIRDYIDRYPAGRYRAEARALLAEIERRSRDAQAARAADDAAWAQAKAAGTIAAIRAYLDAYPSGRNAAEARVALQELERVARQPQPRDCPTCPEMVRIPPGSFLMGATPGEHERLRVPPEYRAEELPQHRVTIAYAFSMGKYEVTRAEFAAFVQARGYRAEGNWRNPGFAQTDRDPVVNLSWTDASAYVAWLSEITGKTYRLPTEAEWEYAARARTTTARYWGDRHQDSCRYANVDDASHGCADGYRHTAPVGSFEPNGFGLYDTIGNAWEWTTDCWNKSYDGAPQDGGKWDRGDCGNRVLRGGAWYYGPWSTRVANRGKFWLDWERGKASPDVPTNGFGLRVVRLD